MFVFEVVLNRVGDGRWWPESYYLGILQAREALYDVSAKPGDESTADNMLQTLSDSVLRGEMGEMEAIKIVERALYLNAAKLYHLE